jgi:uncharacterized membrane protein
MSGTGDADPLPRPGRAEERNVPPALRGLVTRVLRTGVVLMIVLVGIGIVLFLSEGGGPLLSGPLVLSKGPVGALLGHATPGGFILLGLLVLVFTPLSRVILSVILFAKSRDRAFTGITLFVLLVLLATIAVGVLQ